MHNSVDNQLKRFAKKYGFTYTGKRFNDVFGCEMWSAVKGLTVLRAPNPRLLAARMKECAEHVKALEPTDFRSVVEEAIEVPILIG